jgi:hypothetical protein
MKTLKIHLLTATILLSLFNFSPVETKAQAAVSFQVFYHNLAPYGTWVNYPGYGYAWAPATRGAFRPYYTGGHWAFTEMGWMWVSHYKWGWAPFHYGTWVMDPLYGWLWVPGYEWAPAWVEWGYYDGYYGWAPYAPGYVSVVGYRPPIDYWVFAHPHYMTRGDLYRNAYPATNHRISIGSNTITNVQRISPVMNTNQRAGISYNAGPPRQDFERVAKTTLATVAVRESGKPGRTEVSGNTVNIYRPRVEKMEDARPVKVAKIEDLRREQGGARNTDVAKPETAPANARQKPSEPQVRPVEPKQRPRNIELPRESPRQRDVAPAPTQPKQIQRERKPMQQQQPRQMTPTPALPRERGGVPREMAPGRPMNLQPVPQPAPQERGRRK